MSVTYSKTFLERLILTSPTSSPSPAAGSTSSAIHAIAVIDSLEQSSLPLLIALASHATSRAARPVLVVCIDHPPSAWRALLAAAPETTLVDLRAALPYPSAATGDWIATHMAPPVTHHLKTHPGGALIVIDSLTPLVPLYPTPARFARALATLIADLSAAAQVLLPLTASPSTTDAVEALTYVTPTTLRVVNSTRALRELSVLVDRDPRDLGLGDVACNAARDVVVHVHSVRGGGGGTGAAQQQKVSSESVRVTLASGAVHFGVFPPPEDPVAVGETAAAAAAADPTAGLSFNLKLTDKQRQAKDKVVLPHFKMQHLDTAPAAAAGGGVIHYELDLEDDFDDDDPDADLDL